MFWETKFSTLGVVIKMEKYSVVNVSHVITEKMHFLKLVLKIKHFIFISLILRQTFESLFSSQ